MRRRAECRKSFTVESVGTERPGRNVLNDFSEIKNLPLTINGSENRLRNELTQDFASKRRVLRATRDLLSHRSTRRFFVTL